ncbi:nuclear transport factor 2 family protein [Amycolatopsis pithecellobii]|uniref:Nuclear transport factor 2 family protein n=1 Tax=Amycolatopsis pithecellobii TaxID=664692 RepID=A0A6N7Z4B5_9PSEU|nr:nuclear transport factor 2 family protein [Amycolatopsis pithecellobii]MTD55251.1 nuclear transport factor 2 family protein [Amycolatopsis pithecellobii]
MATTIDLIRLSQDVGHLMDRMAISDLLIAFARAIDTKDWAGYAALFTEDGVVEIPVKLPDGTFARHIGRAGMAAWIAGDANRPGLGRFVQTHHLSANHQITIDHDTATTTSYAQCIHRLDDDPANVWELGGWYSCEVRRTPDAGWRFTRVHLDMVWEHGKPVGHG